MAGERRALGVFLAKHLGTAVESDDMFPGRDMPRFRKFLSKLTSKIAKATYEVVENAAHGMNLYTYELRSGSKAERIFLGSDTFVADSILWKELLVFFMNSEVGDDRMEFIRSMPPLPFDPALSCDYLQCFAFSDSVASVMEELQALYVDVPDPGERLEKLDLIDNPNAYFGAPPDEDH